MVIRKYQRFACSLATFDRIGSDIARNAFHLNRAALFDFEGASDLQSWTIWNTGNKTIASTYRYGVALPEGSDEWLAIQGSLISLAKVAGHCR